MDVEANSTDEWANFALAYETLNSTCTQDLISLSTHCIVAINF